MFIFHGQIYLRRAFILQSVPFQRCCHAIAQWFNSLTRLNVPVYLPIYFDLFKSRARSLFFSPHTHTHARWHAQTSTILLKTMNLWSLADKFVLVFFFFSPPCFSLSFFFIHHNRDALVTLFHCFRWYYPMLAYLLNTIHIAGVNCFRFYFFFFCPRLSRVSFAIYFHSSWFV